MKAALAGLQCASSSHPCAHCECDHDRLHQPKSVLQQRGWMLERSYKRLCMSGHCWGEEVGLTEPYKCPFCSQEITGPGQHPSPDDDSFPKKHGGKIPGRPPLLPIEPKHYIPDCLHGSLLRVAPRVFHVTHTRNLYTKEDAEKVGNVYMQNARVTNYTSYFTKKNRDSKVELQSWNGHECWGSIAFWEKTLAAAWKPILEKQATSAADARALAAAQQKYSDCKKLYELYINLLAAVFLDISDDNKHVWRYRAAEVGEAAEAFRAQMVITGDEFDISVSMHEIICHYEDIILANAPIIRGVTQRIEAQHQVQKRARTRHSNHHNAKAANTNMESTCVLQVGRRSLADQYVRQRYGPFTGKRKRSEVFTGYQALADIMEARHTTLMKRMEDKYHRDCEAAAMAMDTANA